MLNLKQKIAVEVPTPGQGRAIVFMNGGPNGALSVKLDSGVVVPVNAAGVQGVPGVAGPQGLKGDKGDAGAQGLRGLQGIQGVNGNEGAKGATGNTGTKGDTGATGGTGNAGAVGAQGSAGAQGVKGDPGPPGAQGVAGQSGTPGLKGDTGAAGPKGDTGSMGAPGTQGPQGAKGDAGLGLTEGNINIKIVGAQFSTSPHGLGKVPLMADLWLFCLAPANGYVPGDWVKNEPSSSISISMDSVNTTITQVAANSLLRVIPKNGGNAVAIVATSWQWRLRCFG